MKVTKIKPEPRPVVAVLIEVSADERDILLKEWWALSGACGGEALLRYPTITALVDAALEAC